MSGWQRHRVLLALLSAGSVIAWAAIAVAVFLVGGDRLDLGIESTVRKVHATAIAAWNADRPGSSAFGQAVPKDGSAQLLTHSAGADQASEPDVVALRPAEQPTPALVEPAPAAEAVPTEVPAASSGPAPAVPTASADAATLGASIVPLTAPLLLADPPLRDLTDLDKEMAASAPGRTVQIRYLETTLNAEIAALLADRTDLPYDNVSVDLGSTQVSLRGNVRVLGMAIQAEVRGSLLARDCTLHLEIESVKIGRLFTPVAVRDQMEKLVDDALDWYPADYPLCIDRVVVQYDRATLYAHRR